MNLNSVPYVLFLAAAAGVYRLLKPGWRNGFLLAVSWLFYLICTPRFLPLLLATTLWTYGLGLAMERRPNRKKALLVLGLCINFGILFLLKYLGFFAELVNGVLARLGIGPVVLPSLLHPPGNSIYT